MTKSERISIWAGILLTMSACDINDSVVANSGSSDGGVVNSSVDELAELAGITLYHNQARLAENASPPLPQLTWDPALATIAANWAAQCRDVDPPIGLIDHNPGRSMTYPNYVGENIYGGAPSAKAAVDLWMTEKADYDLASNTCNGGCGHYTQIVWRATLKVGCAISRCPNLRFSDSIICNYGPGGNFNGQRPY